LPLGSSRLVSEFPVEPSKAPGVSTLAWGSVGGTGSTPAVLEVKFRRYSYPFIGGFDEFAAPRETGLYVLQCG